MKLPKISLLEIYQQVLLESVPSQPILDAIHNRNYVEINYIDNDSNAPGLRLIQPYAYGLSKANNPVLRAFQVSGDSLRKRFWKTFRLDRIVSWKPRISREKSNAVRFCLSWVADCFVRTFRQRANSSSVSGSPV